MTQTQLAIPETGPACDPSRAQWLTPPALAREHVALAGTLLDDAPCCGAGTTLAAALRTGRRAVGGDQMREHAELAAARVSRPVQRPLFLTGGDA